MNVNRNALVISEIALALALSVGVLTQSSLRLLHVPVGSILRTCGGIASAGQGCGGHRVSSFVQQIVSPEPRLYREFASLSRGQG